MSNHIVTTSDDSFDQDVLQAQHPVLVDFWAEWCGPCRAIAPTLDKLAEEYQGKITVAKLNVDNNPNTPGRYGVRGIPSLILFKDGNVVASKVGAMSESQLKAFIDENS